MGLARLLLGLCRMFRIGRWTARSHQELKTMELMRCHVQKMAEDPALERVLRQTAIATGLDWAQMPYWAMWEWDKFNNTLAAFRRKQREREHRAVELMRRRVGAMAIDPEMEPWVRRIAISAHLDWAQMPNWSLDDWLLFDRVARTMICIMDEMDGGRG